MMPPPMPHSQLTQFVRRLVASALPRHCGPEEAAIEESIMIRQGVYCGRRFQTAGGYAIWFVEAAGGMEEALAVLSSLAQHHGAA